MRTLGSAREQGFTLVELMVVVLVLGILVAVAIPVFFASERRAAQRACWTNQREVEAAYQTYVSSTHATVSGGDWASLVETVVPDYIQDEPSCPGGGAYSFDGEMVSCSIPEHAR